MEQKKSDWMRKTDTGELFAFNPFLAKRSDMEPYYGTLPWLEKKEEPEPEPDRPVSAIPEGTMTVNDDERTMAIVRAIKSIPKENWAPPVGKRPTMPKLADIMKITEFSVTATEVQEALKGV